MNIEQPWTIVAATGHRAGLPNDLIDRLDRRRPGTIAGIRWHLRRLACVLRDEHGTTVGLSGMARGVDLWWAQAILEAGLILGAHIPCPQQADPWSPDVRAAWRNLCDAADPEYSHIYAPEYDKSVLRQRNEGMIGAADALVAVWDPGERRGGTWSAVCYARRTKPAGRGFHIDPRTWQVHPGLPDTVVVPDRSNRLY